MPTKLQLITTMYEHRLNKVTANLSEWQQFLQSAGRNYKLSFDEQILVHAQHPDATAVLEIDKWNTQFGRWVNRGTIGIAVVDRNFPGNQRLKYYFDIADTHESRHSRPVPIWEMQPEYEADVIETLEATFGELSEKETFSQAIMSAVNNAVVDNITDYLNDLYNCREDSFLEELDELNVEVIYTNLLKSSVAFMLLSRCGIDSTQVLEPEDFMELYNFNTPDTIAMLGNATSAIAEMGLREISSTVLNLQKNEKQQNRTIAKESENSDNIPEPKNERSFEDGSLDLHRSERVFNPRPDAAGGAGSDAWKIRVDAPPLPDESPQRAVQPPANELQAGSAPDGNRADGDGASGATIGADGESRGRDREPESIRPNGVDRQDDEHQESSGGNDTQRPDLRLEEFPTPEEQQNKIEEAAVKTAAFSQSIPQEFIDDDLFRGSGFQEGKYRIYKHFKNNHTAKENADFLKKEYGIGGHSPFGNNPYSVGHDGKGLHFTFGHDSEKITLTWSVVAKRIGELIAADRYLNAAETEEYPQWLEHEEQRRLVVADSTISFSPNGEKLDRSIAPPLPTKSATLRGPLIAEEATAREILSREPTPVIEYSYEYHLGDTIYIGSKKYEIASFNDDAVSLTDPDYPLYSEDFERDDFDSKVQENPRNEHLRIIDNEANQKASSEQITETVDNGQVTVDSYDLPDETDTQLSTVSSQLSTDVERNNFKITDDNLGVGGAKAKFRANMDAIHLLHDLELNGRIATPEEQEILSRYVGWGSLAQAFDENNASWADEYLELQTSLSTDEYESARASTLNAHYTSPVVIKAMYKALENMGFKSGNILDPGCGVGNFQGLLPDSMSGSKVYGIEIDSITGRICRQLYQKNSIAIQGYEDTALPDSFFDLAIGNVPFGGYGVSDKKYDKHKFMIHDFFFAKTLDKVRPGGVIAFITSKGTMDKKNSAVRKYIAQRAELLGAIRLPNNAFLANAGTQVTSDIIFLQKRDRVIDVEPEWLNLDETEDGIPINSYFIEHPEMMLGTMSNDSGARMYGNENSTTCLPYPDRELADLLDEAIQNIHAEISDYERDADELDDGSIPADPSVRNFSFAVIDGKVFFREDSRMKLMELSATAESRIKGMIEIRDCVRNLIELQTEDYPDSEIQAEQARLNRLYDRFTKKYGLIGSRANISAFCSDSSFPLLGALEVIDEDGKLLRKADFFSKRTIRPKVEITHVDTASEALAVSLGERARVDLAFMSELTGKDEDVIIMELEGIVFQLPQQGEPVWVTADDYLSGNVREKLITAKEYAERKPEFEVNVKALEAVQPEDLSASEIAVRLGATWLPTEIVQQFMFELLETPGYARWNIKVRYLEHSAEWNIEGKSYDKTNIRAFNTYGTQRVNAYKIIEETLNLRDVRVFDYVEEDGKKKAVLNKKETMLAQAKQEQIKSAFQEWLWKDPPRRERLCRIYNDKFNAIRPRVYDGSHINFVGMNPAIELREHQINAVAHVIYGGNTLLAHEVGAGKTFEMVAAAMEMKRLGLCSKSMIVVPNHIIEQFAAEWLQLYPSANILVSTKKDFEPKNRRKFCARIATGDYDAVIIGHSQFEKIPMSIEFQREMLENQLEDLLDGIAAAKHDRGDRVTIKQLEKSRKSLQLRLDKLNDQSRKDDLVTFEELGVDRLFVDESHGYKNLYLYTKMRNVGGIAQTEAQKSSDMFMKTRYMDKRTNGRGVIFATGTPINNSMVELYSIQRYLQYDVLQRNNLQHFDCWASTFGETVTAIELAPEGSGYRAKTRFAKFYNLPELMSMFREVADIQTADTLNLPTPQTNFHNVVITPSDMQTEMVEGLAERAEKVRARMVDSSEDNMLMITNDGRKLALDQRLMNPMLPDYEHGKAAVAAENIYRHWDEGRAERLTQLCFCDLSTPKSDSSFNVYDDIRTKLIAKGVPAEEIAFIHNADSEAKKKELFAKVRQGKVRILMGSTAKCGSGMNVQDRLVALHDLDVPWRPSDMTQRLGRIKRQGNRNPEVEIYRYVTEKTFDAYVRPDRA